MSSRRIERLLWLISAEDLTPAELGTLVKKLKTKDYYTRGFIGRLMYPHGSHGSFPVRHPGGADVHEVVLKNHYTVKTTQAGCLVKLFVKKLDDFFHVFNQFVDEEAITAGTFTSDRKESDSIPFVNDRMLTSAAIRAFITSPKEDVGGMFMSANFAIDKFTGEAGSTLELSRQHLLNGRHTLRRGEEGIVAVWQPVDADDLTYRRGDDQANATTTLNIFYRGPPAEIEFDIVRSFSVIVDPYDSDIRFLNPSIGKSVDPYEVLHAIDHFRDNGKEMTGHSIEQYEYAKRNFLALPAA